MVQGREVVSKAEMTAAAMSGIAGNIFATFALPRSVADEWGGLQ